MLSKKNERNIFSVHGYWALTSSFARFSGIADIEMEYIMEMI